MIELTCSCCGNLFETESDLEAEKALALQQECPDGEYWIVCPDCDESYALENRILNPMFPLDFEMNLTKILTIQDSEATQ